MATSKAIDRLFVPLAGEPYSWFDSGAKLWELRRYGGQYTERNVYPGRRVELRRGYSDQSRALWGTVDRVEKTPSIDEFFNRVPFHEVIPNAETRSEAISFVREILGIDNATPMLGFKVNIDRW
jgi:hypothetical protein